MSDPTTGVIDCYGLRFNWGTNQLEMNTGDETWVAVPLTNNVTFPAITAADIDSGAATDGKVLTADGAGGADWEVIPS